MGKDCIFYEIPEKCKDCDYKTKCTALKILLEMSKLFNNKGLLGLIPRPSIKIGGKDIKI